jgi:hypothetical protein
MRKHWLSLGVLVSIVLAVCLTWAWWNGRQPRITEDTFNQIQPGMRLVEVEAVLGSAPGDFVSDKQIAFVDVEMVRLIPQEEQPQQTSLGMPQRWQNNDGLVDVWLDEQGSVLSKRFCPAIEVSWPSFRPRPFERLWYWLRWP